MSENEMGCRGSKSDVSLISVKEQRVDGHRCINLMHLRYALMGFERNYQIRIPSNQLITLRRSYSSLPKNPLSNLRQPHLSTDNINPWFFTGFSDGESNFTVRIFKSNSTKLGWTIQPVFQIGLHKKDLNLLEKIKTFLGVGTIYHKEESSNYMIQSLRDLNVIINHFNKYPLLTKKWEDFKLFSEIITLINQKEHLTLSGFHKIISLRASMNNGLSRTIKTAFPPLKGENTPAIRPKRSDEDLLNSNIDPYWMAGFASAEGCFTTVEGCFFNVNICMINLNAMTSSPSFHKVVNSFSPNIWMSRLLLMGIGKRYYSNSSSLPKADQGLLQSKRDTRLSIPMSDLEFLEWFRGFVDAEGCFMIKENLTNRYSFQFRIGLHKDDLAVLNFIQNRLKIGYVTGYSNVSAFIIQKAPEVKILIDIFSKNLLNTKKRLDFENWKLAYELYIQVKGENGRIEKDEATTALLVKIQRLKEGINIGRSYLEQESKIRDIKITNYWLLGFIEGEGSFSVASYKFRVRFGLGQLSYEKPLLEIILSFLESLPGYSNLNLTKSPLSISNSQDKRRLNSKSFSELYSDNANFFRMIFIPFLESLHWVSKKEKDFKDWCTVLTLKAQGHHLTPEGKEIITKILAQMNSKRLSTNPSRVIIDRVKLDNEIAKLLAGPANFEITADGDIKNIYSGRTIPKGGKIEVVLVNESGEIFKSFDSVKDCALFIGVGLSALYTKVNTDKSVNYDNKVYFIKRKDYK